ncbi:MAG: hypothetical protein GY847_30150 [Proteobacteria bacterium]|nr:hypothetical protein [Pseudomonadota bacterium]
MNRISKGCILAKSLRLSFALTSIHVFSIMPGCSVEDEHSEVSSEDCELCHSGVNHEESFLIGTHAKIICHDCHENPDDELPQRTCVSCHDDTSEDAENVDHRGLPETCEQCHSPKGWTPSIFEHPVPLAGPHQNFTCTLCHGGNPPDYSRETALCVNCHQSDFENNPVEGHKSYPTTCALCHITSGWSACD